MYKGLEWTAPFSLFFLFFSLIFHFCLWFLFLLIFPSTSIHPKNQNLCGSLGIWKWLNQVSYSHSQWGQWQWNWPCDLWALDPMEQGGGSRRLPAGVREWSPEEVVFELAFNGCLECFRAFQVGQSTFSVVGRIMAPPNVHILILRICEFATFCGNGTLQMWLREGF